MGVDLVPRHLRRRSADVATALIDQERLVAGIVVEPVVVELRSDERYAPDAAGCRRPRRVTGDGLEGVVVDLERTACGDGGIGDIVASVDVDGLPDQAVRAELVEVGVVLADGVV